jgi:hypothetical protein
VKSTVLEPIYETSENSELLQSASMNSLSDSAVLKVSTRRYKRLIHLTLNAANPSHIRAPAVPISELDETKINNSRLATFPIETDSSDLSIQKVAIVNVNRLRIASMTEPIRRPTYSPHCFLRNMASVPGRIALGRTGIECPIPLQHCFKLSNCF